MSAADSIQQLKKDADRVRNQIIEVAHNCGESCHLGGSLSMVDILATLYGKVMRYDVANLSSPDRDIFILSKGHCVLGYYSAMNVFGLMSAEVLATFQQNGSHLIAHPVKNAELGIESSNGSLGQGLSFGLGMALGMRLKKQNDRFIYVMMGDGECNEGSVWESAASAAEFKADNLIAVVDINGLRNDGENYTYTEGASLKKVWESFGWHVQEVDGHDHREILAGFRVAKVHSNLLSDILAYTTKGMGVSCMENNNVWHHN